MKRFRFRLEHVLRVRNVQEDMARAELLGANRAAHDAAARVEARLADYTTRTIPRGAHSYEAFERALFLADTAAGAVKVARNDYLDALDVVHARRADWHDARRRVSALERLEDRRRAEHELEMRRAEDRLVDDMVVARFAASTTAGTVARGGTR